MCISKALVVMQRMHGQIPISLRILDSKIIVHGTRRRSSVRHKIGISPDRQRLIDADVQLENGCMLVNYSCKMDLLDHASSTRSGSVNNCGHQHVVCGGKPHWGDLLQLCHLSKLGQARPSPWMVSNRDDCVPWIASSRRCSQTGWARPGRQHP